MRTSAEGTAERLVGTRVRRQLASPESLSRDVGEDVVELDRQEESEQDRAIVHVVCHVGEMPQATSEECETENSQRNALDVSTGTVRQDRHGGEHTCRQRKQRDEQPIPVVGDREHDGQNPGDDHEAHQTFTEKPGGPRVFPVEEETESVDKRHGISACCFSGHGGAVEICPPGKGLRPSALFKSVGGIVECCVLEISERPRILSVNSKQPTPPSEAERIRREENPIRVDPRCETAFCARWNRPRGSREDVGLYARQGDLRVP